LADDDRNAPRAPVRTGREVVERNDGVVTGATEDEVLAAAAAHAAEAHGMSEVPTEVVSAIRAGITDV
jgi:predicted small metal-binding protein